MGLTDMWSGPMAVAAAFRDGEPGQELPTLLLSHTPDSKELAGNDRWDLMLCGHTHGGQLALPLVGTPFAPVRDHRFVRGLNPWKDRFIHTSCGVGNVLGLRFNCRPEVNVLRLVPA